MEQVMKGLAQIMLILTVTQGLAAQSGDDAARAPIELYFRAHAEGRADLIGEAFAPDAKIMFVQDGAVKQWSRDEFAERFKEPAPDENRRVRRVESLTVSGTAASAVLTLDYPDVTFTDHLSLLKAGDQWRIVNKVFSRTPRDPAPLKMKKDLDERMQPFEPFKILGNIYYVGANQISSFLITTPSGHILLDTGPAEMLPQVEANINKLGFKVSDVKILLNSHAHFDHCGGFAEFKRRTRATVVASSLDGQLMARGGKGDFYWGDDMAYEPVHPDRTISDGGRVELGAVTLTAHLTPGHTKGCTSWSMQVMESGKRYDVLFVCGLTASIYKLTNNAQYPNIVGDVRESLRRLRSMHADVMLAPHSFYFDLERKANDLKSGASNPFIDSGELQRHVADIEQEFNNALAAQERQR